MVLVLRTQAKKVLSTPRKETTFATVFTAWEIRPRRQQLFFGGDRLLVTRHLFLVEPSFFFLAHILIIVTFLSPSIMLQNLVQISVDAASHETL